MSTSNQDNSVVIRDGKVVEGEVTVIRGGGAPIRRGGTEWNLAAGVELNVIDGDCVIRED